MHLHASSTKPNQPRQPTILIVEDEEACATTLEIALWDIHGVAVEMVTNGRAAMELLGREDVQLEVLITDLQLPGMDGFELIERVRAHPAYQAVPVLVISGDGQPDTPDRVRRLGVQGHFLKPYSPLEVRKTLERILNASSQKAS